MGRAASAGLDDRRLKDVPSRSTRGTYPHADRRRIDTRHRSVFFRGPGHIDATPACPRFTRHRRIRYADLRNRRRMGPRIATASVRSNAFGPSTSFFVVIDVTHSAMSERSRFVAAATPCSSRRGVLNTPRREPQERRKSRSWISTGSDNTSEAEGDRSTGWPGPGVDATGPSLRQVLPARRHRLPTLRSRSRPRLARVLQRIFGLQCLPGTRLAPIRLRLRRQAWPSAPNAAEP